MAGKLEPTIDTHSESSGGTWYDFTFAGYVEEDKIISVDGWNPCKDCKKVFRAHSRKDASAKRKNNGLCSSDI